MKTKLTITILITYLLGAYLLMAKPRQRQAGHSQEFVRGVNAALDCTLLIGSDMRDQRKHPTWRELDRAVCDRLKVRRDEWFMRIK